MDCFVADATRNYHDSIGTYSASMRRWREGGRVGIDNYVRKSWDEMIGADKQRYVLINVSL